MFLSIFICTLTVWHIEHDDAKLNKKLTSACDVHTLVRLIVETIGKNTLLNVRNLIHLNILLQMFRIRNKRPTQITVCLVFLSAKWRPCSETLGLSLILTVKNFPSSRKLLSKIFFCYRFMAI